MVGEGHTRPRGPSESPDGVDPNIRRTRKTRRDGHNSGVKIWSLCSVSSTLSHANLEQPFRTLAIKWEVNIFLKKSSCVLHSCFLSSCVVYYCVCYHCVGMYPVYICMQHSVISRILIEMVLPLCILQPLADWTVMRYNFFLETTSVPNCYELTLQIRVIREWGNDQGKHYIRVGSMPNFYWNKSNRKYHILFKGYFYYHNLFECLFTSSAFHSVPHKHLFGVYYYLLYLRI